jgi:hypothetical protein
MAWQRLACHRGKHCCALPALLLGLLVKQLLLLLSMLSPNQVYVHYTATITVANCWGSL